MDRLSVIIPSLNEELYLNKTVSNVLENAEGDIEVIAIADGYDPNPPLITRDERVKIIQLEKSIGQRAGYNLGVKESTGKYVMKIDAHAKLSPGFDVVLKSHCPEKTIVPSMVAST